MPAADPLNEASDAPCAPRPADAPDYLAHAPGAPCVILAPMEGLADVAMRALLCADGGASYLVTEFVRISQDVPGEDALRRMVPELAQKGRTRGGTPAHVQLLGSCPERMGRAAARAAQLGALAIDLNFGCPARTVNRHDGGASLLRTPARMAAVVAAVRAAVPRSIPVSAKLRLGWDDVSHAVANAQAAVAAGADWLTLHGRTKAQGYAPPVDWPTIGLVAREVPVPVVANGDLFDVEALARCQEQTGCTRFMLGRGAVARPGLLAQAQAFLRCGEVARARATRPVPHWPRWVAAYAELCRAYGLHPHGLGGRIKQWGLLAQRYGDGRWFDRVKRLRTVDEMLAALDAAAAQASVGAA